MNSFKNNEISKQYGRVAENSRDNCCGNPTDSVDTKSLQIGYSADDVGAVPEGANMGLGCGNPQAIAALQTGEIVLDLGSGGGFDCFLAAQKVGDSGHVIGVDMTLEMVDKARANAKKGGYQNVEFRLGEIEHLPVADNKIDVVISNCVINLCNDKLQVFTEIKRVLTDGGCIIISDTLIHNDFTNKEKAKLGKLDYIYNRFITMEQYRSLLDEAGIVDAEVLVKGASCFTPESTDPIAQLIYQKLGKDWKSSERFSTALVTGKK